MVEQVGKYNVDFYGYTENSNGLSMFIITEFDCNEKEIQHKRFYSSINSGLLKTFLLSKKMLDYIFSFPENHIFNTVSIN